VRVAGERVELSALEFALLTRLAADPRRVFTKDELLRDVWGFQAPVLRFCPSGRENPVHRGFAAVWRLTNGPHH
jgi:hypothetical protein